MKQKQLKLKKQPTLQSELKDAEFSYNVARTKWQYDLKMRTYPAMAQFFGRRTYDPVLLTKHILPKDIELFYQQIQKIIKDKYACRNSLGCNLAVQESNNQLPTREPDSIRTITIDRIDSTSEEQTTDRSRDENQSTFVARYPTQRCSLLTQKEGCNQVKVAQEMWDAINRGETGLLLMATTGAGKTFVVSSLLKNFIEQGYTKKSLAPSPLFVITKASIVQQTKQVIKEEFGMDIVNMVKVINIEFLRTEIGKLYVKEEVLIENGQEHIKYKWTPMVHPILVWIDECQMAAREMAQQSKILLGLTELPNVTIIMSSATPFAKVSEAKVFACATKRTFPYGLQQVKITPKTWSVFATQVAFPSDPNEYCTAAAKRLVEFFEPNIFRIKNIRPQHKSRISTQQIYFRNNAEQESYDKSLEKYYEKKAKIAGDDSMSEAQKGFADLAAFTIFCRAAEVIRAPYLADFANNSWANGKAPGIACRFKSTIVATIKCLILDYGWSRDDISIIWGGSTETLSDKAKMNKRIKASGVDVDSLLKGIGLSMDDLGLDFSDIREKNAEDLAFEKEYKLLSQNLTQREEERMRYQRQDSRLLIFTFASGGVGLSAHHESRFPNARPREGILTPVYSEKQLIQGTGRLHRITSASDTSQVIVHYAGTIEEHVAFRVQQKLKCMKEIVRARESWEDIITKSKAEIEDEQNFPEDQQQQLIEDADMIASTMEYVENKL